MHAGLHPADGSERLMLFESLDATDRDDLLVLNRGLIGKTGVRVDFPRRRPQRKRTLTPVLVISFGKVPVMNQRMKVRLRPRFRAPLFVVLDQI